MLTLIEINKAINNTIKKALGFTDFKDVPLCPEDVTEPIIRPSIKVEMDSSKNGRLNSCMREKTLTIRVYFFASNLRKYKIENLKMQDVLENAFLDGLYVDGAYIPIEEVESDVTDTVLICSFILYLAEGGAVWQDTIDPITGDEISPGTNEPVEIMEEIELKGELK
ncbi:phage tail terminator family protein [Anaerotignum sp. MB30-C6]|uniref:phage tail terminator family protein n=1 Tax=Anaerotignum sp. MB30-C6 TaxID=3070814 RepID=UPI0027DB38FA|nr:hypothetical protein [Anaerotignum sp. MB30-C6]WMI80904.1 hypothetical protein RBQ60_13955 [Anaerotignum sp. MB30-C6]